MRFKASDLKYKKFKNLKNYFDVIKFVSGTEDTKEKRKTKIKKISDLVCTKPPSLSLVSAMPFIPSLTSLPAGSEGLNGNRRVSINSKSSSDDILKELEKLKSSFETVLEKSLEASQNIELIKSFLNGRGVSTGIEIDPFIYLNGLRIENEGKYLNEILGKTSDKKMVLTFNLAVIPKYQKSSENHIFNCSKCNEPCDACLKKLNENLAVPPVAKSTNFFSKFLNWFRPTVKNN